MGAAVTFDYATWLARYPEFSNVNSSVAQLYFNEATLYQVNDGSGPVCDQTTQLTLLNMLTAHIAYLNSGVSGTAPSQIVGRIADATVGSVHVAAQNDYPPGTVQWYQQSKYGSAWYAATAVYRGFRTIPAPCTSPFGVAGYGPFVPW